jgi:hypothetical protein
MITTLMSIIGTLLAAEIARMNYDNYWHYPWVILASVSGVDAAFGMIILGKAGFTWL